MNGDNAPVTRAELKKELAELKTELKAEFPTKDEMKLEITTGMAYVVETLGARMDAMHADLSRQIAGAARAAAEENRRDIGIVDDKYRDLPGRIAVLERDLEEHRLDTTLHPRRKR